MVFLRRLLTLPFSAAPFSARAGTALALAAVLAIALMATALDHGKQKNLGHSHWAGAKIPSQRTYQATI
jgi:hypothetical protein